MVGTGTCRRVGGTSIALLLPLSPAAAAVVAVTAANEFLLAGLEDHIKLKATFESHGRISTRMLTGRSPVSVQLGSTP